MRNFTRDGELKIKTDASSGGSSEQTRSTLLRAGIINTLTAEDDGIAALQDLSVLADEDGIATAQAPAANTPMSLEPDAASLIPPRRITFRSIADLSALTFEIVGLDAEGDAVSELLNGPNGAPQDDDAIALAQAPTASTPLVLEAAADSLYPPRPLTFTSSSDLSGVNFEIVGTDENGEPQTVAAFQGPNNGTVTTVELWSEITSITPDATNASTVSVGWPDTYGSIDSSNAYREVSSITPDASDVSNVEVGWRDTDTAYGLVLQLSTFDPWRRITLSSTDDLSTVNFLLLGTDLNGQPLQVLVQGPSNGTVATAERFSTLTAIIPQSIGTGSVSAGWPNEPATLYRAAHDVELSHVFLRNTDPSAVEIDLTLLIDGEEIPWRHFALEEDESASVLHGETPLPLPQDTELRASVTSSGVVAFTVHGTERT